MPETAIKNGEADQGIEPDSFTVETPKVETGELIQSADTIAADQIIAEATESFRLKDKIQQAADLEELGQVVVDVPLIQIRSEHYTGKEIAGYINEANKFLADNLDAIILYTITRQDDSRQKVFANLVRKIPAGGDLAIQEKTKELMKGIMNEQFQEKKKEFILGSVAEVQDLETLYFVLGQFRLIKEGQEIYDKQEVINSIKKARGILVEAAIIGDLAEKSPQELEEEIRKTLIGVGGIPPHDSGIFEKASELIAKEVKEKMVERKIENISNPTVGRKGLRGRFRKWFGR